MLTDVQDQPDAVGYLRRIVTGDVTNPVLLVGDEGVGRRFSVVQAAHEMFCRRQVLSCQCIDCVQLRHAIHPDFLTVSHLDDKEIGIEPIRAAIDWSLTKPAMAPVRICHIEAADCLTTAAANALLKTLEEPSPTVRFFLSTESYERVIPTIRSRCGRIGYRNLSETFILSVLSRYESDDTKALVYTRIADGSVGRAIQFWTQNRLKLRDCVLTVVNQGLQGDVSAMFASIDDMGSDLPVALRFFEHLSHDFLIASVDSSRMINLDVAEQIQSTAASVSPTVWERLRLELKELFRRWQTFHLNLPFHVKTGLVNAFSAV